MATNVRWRRRFFYTAGAEFIAGNFAGADLRLRQSQSDGTDQGAVGSFTSEGNGLWYIDIDVDTYGSDYYLVEFYTDAAAVWAAVGALDPVFIDLKDCMPLTGGTMSGAIAMGDKSVTGVNSITFTDTAGTIGLTGGGAGEIVANGNLIDKTADETITGAWTFSGDCTLSGSNTVTGITSYTTDKCLVNSIIVQPYFLITKSFGVTDLAADIDQVLFTCDTKMTVISVEAVWSVAATGQTLQVERLSGVEAIKAGDNMLDPAFDLTGVANTIVSEKAPTNATLAAGDRIAIYVSGAPTDLERLCVTIKIRYGD